MLALLALVATAHAGITYLDCTADGSSFHFLTTVNEPAGIVTYQDARGVHEVPAQFTANAVYFPDRLGSGITLSRVDLSEKINGMKIGQCHIIRQPKRAF
jgi:hypothetical protein